MSSKRKVLVVFIYLRGHTVAVPAAKLTLLQESSTLVQSVAQYDRSYSRRPDALSLDPLDLPLPVDGVNVVRTPGGGLHEFGALRDAAPDAWGRRVIENKLHRQGPLPESDYLLHAGATASPFNLS